MKLIIILLALKVERYFHFGNRLKRFSCFEPYINLLRRYVGETFLWKGYLGVATALIPMLLIIGLIYYLLGHFLYGIVGAIIAFIILVYCLGPDDLYARLARYFTSAEGEKTQESESHLTSLLTDLDTEVSEGANANRALTKTIFWQFNVRIFAVLFWFIILGPLGAILYRMMALLAKMPLQEDSPNTGLIESADYVQAVLDWIPVRLLGLGYALVGDFSNTFSYWFQHVCSGLDTNRTFVEQSGLTALRLTEEEKLVPDVSENKTALGLIDRTLIVYLVVVALFVLGAWIY